MRNEVLVSVIVPNFNHSQYLEKRIRSILNQTYKNFEIILMDDFSTDQSVEILEKYVQNSKVANLIVNEKNSGSPFGMWEKGISLAKGKYIWIAESDDWSAPDFLEKIIYKLENSDAILGHCNSYFQTVQSTQLNSWWNSFGISKWENEYLEEGSNLIHLYGKYKCPVINVSSAVFKREIIKSEFYPTQFRYCGDWWFWIQLFMEGKVVYDPSPMNYVRIHNQSATRINKFKSLLQIRENVLIVNDVSKLLDDKLTYSKQYDWLIDMWLEIIVCNGKYFSIDYHRIDLPISFKFVFYKRFFSILIKKLIFKIYLK